METIDKGAPFVVDTREVLPEESVGVIDVQKEREAFEVYLLSQGVDLKYLPCIYFNGTSYDQEDGDEDHEVALGEINLGWNAWQAAKASAVPEPSQEKTWDEIHLDPKERLYWSLRSAKKRKSDLNWHHASHQTCVGSTHGRKICEYLGVDPDAKDFVRSQEPSHD